MRRLVVTALALAGAAACSHLFELPATETSPTDPDAGDAAVDAGPDDATLFPFVPYDAPPPPRFCASQTTPSLYCADLDDAPPPALEAVGALRIAGGRVALSSAVSASPPRALLASASGDGGAAAVSRALGASPDALTLSFAMLVSAWPAGGAELSAVEIAVPTGTCAVRLAGTAAHWAVAQVCDDGATETARLVTESTAPIAPGAWHRFAIAIAFAPTPTVSLDVDGARVVDVAGVTPLAKGPVTLAFGVGDLPSGTVTLFQDDLLVTSP